MKYPYLPMRSAGVSGCSGFIFREILYYKDSLLHLRLDISIFNLTPFNAE